MTQNKIFVGIRSTQIQCLEARVGLGHTYIITIVLANVVEKNIVKRNFKFCRSVCNRTD